MWKLFKNWILNIADAFRREIKLVFRDPGIILFVTFLPLAYPIIYSLIYNPELVKDVEVVVVDNDRTPLSRELTRKYDACDQAKIIGYAADLSEAKHAMNSHDCYAILEIPSGFERDVTRNQTGNAVLYADMSLLLRYRGLLVAATNVTQEMGAELLTEKIDQLAPLAETISSGDILPIHNISLGNIRNGFDSFIMPGVLILILHQCIVLAAGMSGGAKRENPSLADPKRYSVSTSMLGQSIAYIVMMIIPTIFMLYFVPIIFKFPMKGDILEEFIFILPMIIACIGVGFTFQAIVREREEVFVLWVFTSLLFLFLSGLIWPIYDMWPIWKAIGAICPSTWGVEGFIKMNALGSSLAQVRNPYIYLWILAAGWNIIGWACRKFIPHKTIDNAQELA